MKISVIIPTYNRSKVILRAVKSVLAQSYKASEIIVVDDGSNDNTKELLKDLQDKIVYIFQKNSGVSSARNRGIKKAKYSWIAFLDSDDEWHKDKLKLQTLFHKQNKNILFSHTDELWIRDDKIIKQKAHHKKPSGECFLDNLNFCKIAPSTVMINKKVFDEIGYFDENLKVCEDYDLWLRIALRYHVGFIDQKLVTKYSGDDQLSYKYFGMDRFRVYALEKHLNSRYHVEVKKEIIKKIKILKDGALKHNNRSIYNFYTTKLQELTT